MTASRYVCVLLGHDWTVFTTRTRFGGVWVTTETHKVCHRCKRTVVK